MLGPQDLWIALALGVFFFGAKKLPELSRSLGQAMSEFKKGVALFFVTVHESIHLEFTSKIKCGQPHFHALSFRRGPFGLDRREWTRLG